MDKIYITDDLLARFLTGEADGPEKEIVKAWVDAHADNLKILTDYKAMLDATKIEVVSGVNQFEALKRLDYRLQQKERFGFKKLLKYAAILLISVTCGLLFYSKIMVSSLNISTSAKVVRQNLPDGSVVTLNKKSAVSYLGGPFNTKREVQLHGEAFFKVSPDKSKPFVISVNRIKITVVGTEFNVKTIKGQTLVIVEKGVVRVNNQKESIQLSAGEKIQLGVNNAHLTKGKNNGKLYNYYYSNELVCENTPLKELVNVLNEKFKAHIIVSNPELNSLALTTTFRNESLEDILKVVAETFKITVEYHRNGIRLK